MSQFHNILTNSHISDKRNEIDTLQINVGYLCNLACKHCHLACGPSRQEVMDERTVDRLIEIAARSSHIRTIDLTGGAPEMNPHFRKLVSEMTRLGKKVIVRTNLTIYLNEAYKEVPVFLKENKAQIVASMPCYLKQNVDLQRGGGTYNSSVEALRILNQIGYGVNGSDLVLNLVYNPGGPFLPPEQHKLEEDYKKNLKDKFGIEFTKLLTITNLSINRFKEQLEKDNKLNYYNNLLIENFNPEAAKNIMCKNLVSISWDGRIFDCDFNQALGLELYGNKRTIWEIQNLENLEHCKITFEDHCFGCTAGAGSSCSGALI